MFLKTLPYVSSSPQIIDRRPNVTFMNRVAPPLKIAAGKNLGYLLVIAELHRKRRIVVSLRLIAPAVRSFEVARENLEILVQQHDVRRVLGDVGRGLNRDTGVRIVQGDRVVDPVAEEPDIRAELSLDLDHA